MDPKKRRSLLLHLALIALTALSARFLLLYAIGPQSLPDTAQYLEVSRNLAETGTFSALDPATGKLAPFAGRVPVFHAATAVIVKLFGPEIGWPFSVFNILVSTATVLLTAALFCSLAGLPAGLLAGYFMALNPNALYYSVEILPDTFFSLFVLLAAMIGLRALRAGSLKWYLGWGLSIGFAALIKPVFKYFWAAPPVILLCERTLRETTLKRTAVFLAGFVLMVSPWLARNYTQLGFPGFESQFGMNTLWATTDLVRPSTAEQVKEDPELAKVRDIVAASGEPMLAVGNVKTRLNMGDNEVNAYLFRIGKEVMLHNPGQFWYRYAKNVVNFVASGSSVVELSYKLLPGGDKYKSAITASLEAGKRLPDKEKFRRILTDAFSNGTWPALAINAAARAACLAVFVISTAGLLLLFRQDRPGALLLLALIAYFILISSFTSGYDRYRLPIDPLLAGLFSTYICAKFAGRKKTAE